MRCEDCAESLPGLLEGLLPENEARESRAHLAGCSACRAALALQEEIAAGLRTPPAPQLPRDFTARVLVRAGVKEVSRRRARRRWLPAAAAALAAACGVGLIAWVGRLAGAPGGERAWHGTLGAFAAGMEAFLDAARQLASGLGTPPAAGMISAWGMVLVSIVALAPILWGLVKAAEFYQE